MATLAPKQLLLIAKSGPVADGLVAVFLSTAGVQVGGRLDKVPSRQTAQAAPVPSMVVFECGPRDREVSAEVQKIKGLWPGAKCLVLADNVQQRKAAEKAGADGVLIKGCQPTELIGTVEALLH